MTVPTPQPSEIDRVPEIAGPVRTAMAVLDGLDDRPLAEHVEVFERVHAVLGEALADPGVA